DILFARTGASVGKTYRYDESDGVLYYAGFLIRAKINPEYDVEFIFQNTLTNNYSNFVQITSQRSGQPGINAKEYANFEFLAPTLEEQTRIGAFFQEFDNLIAIHQRK
ncbi:MAG: restriction endonuclease subunit S, partial [Culicoidibacterales bacterium]